MRVLITNDDGIRADGLIALAETMRDAGEIVIVAPASQQSAVSHSITLHKPLRCNPEVEFPVDGVRAYSTNGTPTDAVLLGIHAIFGEKPDVVISGINCGPNLGADVTYSGTVAGAMEGVVARVPSISASMGAFDNLKYHDCAEFIRRLALVVGKGVFPDDMLLNVNYPNLSADDVRGVKITSLGLRWYDDVVHERVDPRGMKYYWISGKKVLFNREPGTDAHEMEQGYISVTPLTLDMTRTSSLKMVTEILADQLSVNLENDNPELDVQGP